MVPIICVRKPKIKRKMIAAVWIHLPCRHTVATLRCLPVSLLEFGARTARKFADIIRAEEAILRTFFHPKFELRWLFENANEHRRSIRQPQLLQLPFQSRFNTTNNFSGPRTGRNFTAL